MDSQSQSPSTEPTVGTPDVQAISRDRDVLGSSMQPPTLDLDSHNLVKDTTKNTQDAHRRLHQFMLEKIGRLRFVSLGFHAIFKFDIRIFHTAFQKVHFSSLVCIFSQFVKFRAPPNRRIHCAHQRLVKPMHK